MDASVTRFVKSKHKSSNLSDDLIGPMLVIKPYNDNKFYPSTLDGHQTPKTEPPDTTPEPPDVIGKTFLLGPRNDGQQFRARIVKAIEDQEESSCNHPQHQKFLCSVNNEQYKEVFAYNDIAQFIKNDDEDTTVWKYRCIQAHKGPLQQSHPNYKGSQYNVLIEWENGEVTNEPLTIIAKDDPVTCAL